MSRRFALVSVVVAIWLGFAIRIHELDQVPLRGDEAFSAMFWAEMPIHQSLSEIATIEPHPPLTYVIFHIWNLIIGGINSPFALRMLGVFGNLIGIPAMYALGLHLTGKRLVGILGAFMWAIHPFEVWHSQDFRNYALWAALSATSLWLGLRLIKHRQPIDWILYTVIGLVTALMFYTELLTLGALGLYILYRQRHQKKFIFRLLIVQAMMVTIVFIAFLMLQSALLTEGGYGGNVEPFNAPDYVTRFLPTLIFGDTIPIELSSIWIPIFIITIALTLTIYHLHHNIAILVLIQILIPLALLGIVSTRISIFHPRYILSTVPAFILLISVGSYSFAHYLNKRIAIHKNILTLLLISPWFILSTTTLNHYFTNPTHKSQAWDELGNFLNENVTPDDLVIQLSTDAAFGYYYNGTAEDIGLPENPSQPEADIIKELELRRPQHDSIYIVSNAIPDWQNADVVETWANQHMQLVRQSSASGLGIRHYKTWDIDKDISQLSLAQFGEIVDLVDYKLFETPLPTGELVLWLYWRPINQADSSFKSFVHVVGEINSNTNSPLWSQDDQFPQEGRISTQSWERGKIYRDIYYLSTNSLENRKYDIMLGWYNPETNTRLLTQQGSDTYTLTTITYP